MKTPKILSGILATILNFAPVQASGLEQKVTSAPQTKTEQLAPLPDFYYQENVQVLHQDVPKGDVKNTHTFYSKLRGDMSSEVTLKDAIDTIGDNDGLLKLFLPEGFKDFNKDHAKAMVAQGIAADLYSFNNTMKTLNIESNLPIDRFTAALKNKDLAAAQFYGKQISEDIRNLLQTVDHRLLPQLEQAFRLDNTKTALESLIPEGVNEFRITKGKDFIRADYDRYINVDGNAALYSAMETDSVIIEQAKRGSAWGRGRGSMTAEASNRLDQFRLPEINTLNPDTLKEDAENFYRTAVERFFDLAPQAKFHMGYTLEYLLKDTDAVQATLKLKPNLKVGMGYSESYFEYNNEEETTDISLNLKDGLKMQEIKKDFEETGHERIANVFVDKQGKFHYFINIAERITDTTIKRELEINGDYHATSTPNRTHETLVNILAGQELGNGTFTPFVGMKDSEGSMGLYINSRMFTAVARSDGSQETYIKLGRRDSDRLLKHLQEIEKLKYSSFLGSESKIETERSRLAESVKGLALRYANMMDGQEYSVIIGKGKISLEAGQSIDDLVKTDFLRLNVAGVRLKAEYGTDRETGEHNSEQYGIQLGGGTGKWQVDVYQERADPDHMQDQEHPNVNVKISKTFRF